MNSKIVYMRGRSAEAREAQLAQCSRWMARRGWTLVDYSDELGSAVFNRDPQQPPSGDGQLPRWHPARLLPPPGALNPLAWLGGLRAPATPRQWALAGGAAALAVGMYALLVLSLRSPTLPRGAAPEETWLYVAVATLNVRDTPSDNAQIVGILTQNQRVLVGVERTGWVRVLQPEKGYVARRFLNTQPSP